MAEAAETKRSVGEKPLGVAIIICEKVITETPSMNKTLVSTFNSILSHQFPCVHPALSIYVALTNGNGRKQVNLSMKLGNKIILRAGGHLEFSNPNAVVEMIFNLRGIPFAEPGVYSFEVESDGEFIFESRINVAKVNPQ